METQKLKTIRLYGKLGAKFGRIHTLAVSSAAEAIRALCVIIPGFESHMSAAGAQYAVFVGKENISTDALGHPSGRGDIRIAPIPAGAKRDGLANVILGVVLVTVGFFSFGATTATGLAMIAAGVAISAGGAIMMLSPQPKGNTSGDAVENRASYMFNGPVNTVAQGNPVPYFAGRLRVGSCVISAGIYNEERA
jgi:predicted phage tail protein